MVLFRSKIKTSMTLTIGKIFIMVDIYNYGLLSRRKILTNPQLSNVSNLYIQKSLNLEIIAFI